MRSWAEERIKAQGFGETVHMLGRYPAQTMPRFFALADLLLVTLKKDPIFALTIPSKVQSYLACGRPLAAALDGEGARVIEESGGGLVVQAGNGKALAEIVLKIKHMSSSEREQMGKNARNYFLRHFERRDLLDRLDAWIREEVPS
jgi:glycosyltransferase involved in cell wall biosynthesis